jgi:hypothetical protein
LIIDLQNVFPENGKDTDQVLEKGLKSLKTCIDEKKDVPDAMQRYDLGSINFYYGVEGERNKNFKKGYGIAHIIAKRDEEGKTIAQLKGQKGVEVAEKVVEAIAKGNIIKVLEGNQTVWIEYKNYIAVLSFNKDGKEETWLLTGFKVIT